MLVKAVLKEYHQKVNFPWTIKKIKQAKLDPLCFLIDLGRELQKCTDVESAEGKALIEMLKAFQVI